MYTQGPVGGLGRARADWDPFASIPEEESYPLRGLRPTYAEQFPTGGSYMEASFPPASSGLQRGYEEYAKEKGLQAKPRAEYARAYGQALEEIRGPEPMVLPERSADPMENWKQARKQYLHVINKAREMGATPEETAAELRHWGVDKIDLMNPPVAKTTIPYEYGGKLYNLTPEQYADMPGVKPTKQHASIEKFEAINPEWTGKIGTAEYKKAYEEDLVRQMQAGAGNMVLGADPETGDIIIGQSRGPMTPTTVKTGPLVSKTQAPLPPEQAAKVQLIEQALSYMPAIREGIFGADPNKPTVNRTDIANIGLRTPYTKGRELSTLISDAVEAKLRMESGAAVPDTEISRMAKRFIPQFGDDDNTIKLKVDNLEKFLSEAAAKVKVGRPLMSGAHPSTAATGGDVSGMSDAELDAAIAVARGGR